MNSLPQTPQRIGPNAATVAETRMRRWQSHSSTTPFLGPFLAAPGATVPAFAAAVAVAGRGEGSFGERYAVIAPASCTSS